MGGKHGGTTGFTLPADAVDTAHMSGGGDSGPGPWSKFGMKAGKGALGGLAQGLQQMQQPQQGGAPVQFDTRSPQLPPDFMQGSNYLEDAKRRMAAFYGQSGGS